MPNKFTEHYHLSQWEKTDQVLMEDFNADNLAIDEALAGKAEQSELDSLSAMVNTLSGTVSSHTTTLNKKGNCKIETRSYTGNGQRGDGVSISISFSAKPAVFFIFGNRCLFFAGGAASEGTLIGVIQGGGISGSSFGHTSAALEWSGSRVTIPVPTALTNLNSSNQSYQVFAFIQAG